MVSQMLLQKSSAKHLATRRISQKGFEVSIFGHRSCPFSGNFSSLVQSRFRNITKLIYTIIGKKQDHNGDKKKWCQKSDFLDR